MPRKRQPINHGTQGGARAHFRHGVPMCEPCRAAVRRARGFQGPQKIAPCGTRSAYHRHLRRKEQPCEPCKQANRKGCADGRQRRQLERPPLPPDDPRHGTVNAYAYHGCRCPACLAAQSAANHRNQLKRRRGA